MVSEGSEGTLRIWDLTTGQECAILERATGTLAFDYPEHRFPIAFSPNSAVVAIPGQLADRRHLIDLWDVRTGQRVATFNGHRAPITALAFAPDGRRLISGGKDTIAYVWNIPPIQRERVTLMNESQMAAHWRDLADGDAAKAYRALGAWLAAPETTIAIFRRSFAPIKSVDSGHVSRLVADLDADQYAVRDSASRELRSLGQGAREHLREALKTSTSIEVTRRIEAALATTPDEELRTRRAIEVLEAIDTPAARTLLKEWAAVNPDSVVAREVAAALKRMGQQ
jgi:hypothetical protein